MFRNPRFWPAILLILTVWLIPAKGLCVVDDPYAYKYLFGRLLLEYERDNIDRDGVREDDTKFKQTYVLTARGYTLSRRLIIYDAGAAYENNDFTSNKTTTNTTTTRYNFRTTLLPLSAIPLTLYWDRTATMLTTTSETTTTESVYGLNWYMNFRTLPRVYLSAERDLTETSDGDTGTTDLYSVELSKEIGPTENKLNYDLSQSETNGSAFSRYTLNFTNNTDISRNTKFFLGTTRAQTSSTDESSTTLTGVSLSIMSSPSSDFRQTHSFNYYKNEDDTNTQEGNTYDGTMQYEVTRRLHTSFTLDINNTLNDSGTSKSEDKTTSTSMAVSYQLTDAFSISQLLAYSVSDTNSTDPAANVADRETFRELTRLTYAKRLRWARMSASGGLGYTQEKSQSIISGQAIEENAQFSLINIDLNRFVGADMSLTYRHTKTISGDNIDSTSDAYHVSVYNKMWKKYAYAVATYNKTTDTSYLNLIDRWKEEYRLEATSKYFKDIDLRSYYEIIKNFENIIGTNVSTNKGFSARHKRDFYGGRLDLLFDYSTFDSTFPGGSDSLTQLRYTISYARRLLRGLEWSASIDRITQDTDTAFENDTRIHNMLRYPFRSWLLSLEHRYTVTEAPSRDFTESLLLLKASRAFVRVWQ
ncbi:MAG: hypothetical protein ACE5GY_01490 [Thermodesulfobacteriota bacterium]